MLRLQETLKARLQAQKRLPMLPIFYIVVHVFIAVSKKYCFFFSFSPKAIVWKIWAEMSIVFPLPSGPKVENEQRPKVF